MAYTTTERARSKKCLVVKAVGRAQISSLEIISLAALDPLTQGFLHVSENARDIGVMGVALFCALSWVRLFDELTRKEILEQKLSRKLVHISTGLLFMLSWPLFSELLRGPLYYTISVSTITVAFWLKSPVGAIALALLCGGDGMADIVGRRYGSSKLPWNKRKSWAGTLAMFLTGSILALGFLAYFSCFGCPVGFSADAVARVALIALAATFVEFLPITDTLDDNSTVPLTAVVIGSILFPGS